jgi:hypothetical protein
MSVLFKELPETRSDAFSVDINVTTIEITVRMKDLM